MKRVLPLFLLVLLLSSVSALAQDACPENRLTIVTETEFALDRELICDAAQGLISRQLHVYVYVTDKYSDTEDGWYAILDEFDINIVGIYDPVTDDMDDDAFTVEISTRTDHSHGQNIGFDQYLFGTPLDNTETILEIQRQLRADVAAGDMTAAVVNVLNTAYNTAYPPVPTMAPTKVQPTAEPTVVQVQPTEIIAQATPVTSVQGSEVEVTEASPVNVANILIVVGVLIVLALIALVAVWVYRQTRATSELMTYYTRLRKVTRAILIDAERLLTTNFLETEITASGARSDETLLSAIEKRIREARTGHDAAGRAAKVIEKKERKMSRLDWLLHPELIKEIIVLWEDVYITLAGNNRAVLALTEEDAKVFFDPYASIPEEATSALEAQVQHILEQAEGGKYMDIEVRFTKSEDMDNDGVLGHLYRIKLTFDELGEAKGLFPKVLNDLEKAISKWQQELESPHQLITVGAIAEHAVATFEAASDEVEAKRWLEAKRLVDSCYPIMANIDETLITLSECMQHLSQQETGHKAISNQGYWLEESTALLEEARLVVADISEMYIEGDYDRIDELCDTIVELADRALEMANAEVTLRNKNNRLIEQLVERIAEVQLAKENGLRDLEILREKYPAETNHADLDNGTRAAQSLAEIEREVPTLHAHNSFEKQFFVQLSEMLDAQFAELTEIEDVYDLMCERLALIIQLEKVIEEECAEVQASLAFIQTVFLERADWIDDELDDQLAEISQRLEIVEELIAGQEFYLAESRLSDVDADLEEAYARAQEQVTRTENLFTKIRKLRAQGESGLNELRTAFNGLPAAAKLASTKQLIGKSATKYRKIVADESIDDKKDSELAKALVALVKRYESLLDDFSDVSKQIAADAAEYQQLIDSVNNKIREAEEYITSARGWVNKSDAGRSGTNSLQLAVSTLPDLVETSLSIAVLNQKAEDAQRAYDNAKTAILEAKARIAEVKEAREEAARLARLEQQRIAEAKAAAKRAKEAKDAADRLQKQQQEAARRRRNAATMNAVRRQTVSTGGARRRRT